MTCSALLDSPLGPLYVESSEKGIRALRFAVQERAAGGGGKFLNEARRQLEEYWAGKRREFDLPLDLEGTAFQLRVWRALASVPFGETRRYADVARAIGAPRAMRAVGHAVGRNPVWIVIPCHRIIGSDGGLHGYAGGLDRKRRLLEHEKYGPELRPEVSRLCAVR